MESGSLLSKSEWSAKDSLHHKLMDGANRLEVFNSQLYVMNNVSSTISMVDISDPDSINLAAILYSGDIHGPSGSAPVYDDKWLLVASDDSISVFDVERTDTIRMVENHQLRFQSNSSGSGHDLSIYNGLGIGTGQNDNAIFTFRINTS